MHAMKGVQIAQRSHRAPKALCDILRISRLNGKLSQLCICSQDIAKCLWRSMAALCHLHALHRMHRSDCGSSFDISSAVSAGTSSCQRRDHRTLSAVQPTDRHESSALQRRWPPCWEPSMHTGLQSTVCNQEALQRGQASARQVEGAGIAQLTER